MKPRRVGAVAVLVSLLAFGALGCAGSDGGAVAEGTGASEEAATVGASKLLGGRWLDDEFCGVYPSRVPYEAKLDLPRPGTVVRMVLLTPDRIHVTRTARVAWTRTMRTRAIAPDTGTYKLSVSSGGKLRVPRTTLRAPHPAGGAYVGHGCN